ncbi:hypothetical protein ACW14X_15220 [Nocardioides sp. YJ-D4]
MAARLGHTDPSVSLRVYAHAIPERAAEVADRFANLVDQDDDTTEERDDETGEGR